MEGRSMAMARPSFAALVLLLALGCGGGNDSGGAGPDPSPAPPTPVPTHSPRPAQTEPPEVVFDSLDDAEARGFSVIDIREPRELEEMPTPTGNGRHIPMAELLHGDKRLSNSGKHLLICASGRRSLAATEELRSLRDRPGAGEAVFLVGPQHDANRAPRLQLQSPEHGQSLHRGHAAGAVVLRALSYIPGIDVSADQHDLLGLLSPDDLTDHVGRGDFAVVGRLHVQLDHRRLAALLQAIEQGRGFDGNRRGGDPVLLAPVPHRPGVR